MQTVFGRTLEEIAALIEKEAAMCDRPSKIDSVLTELRILNNTVAKLVHNLEQPTFSETGTQRARTIRAIQLELGVPADGVIGPRTRAALRSLGF